MINLFDDYLYDVLALGWYLVLWRSYAWVTDDSKLHKHTLSFAMHEERRSWMLAMSNREHRILDGAIITGLQGSTQFFASTSLLAIGGGFALISASDQLITAMAASTLHLEIEKERFYTKVVVLMVLYAYAFFKFGWAYRLFNYCAIMIAATPQQCDDHREEKALQAADMNIEASKQFNYGLRTFFMSIPVLAWFGGVLAFALVATWVTGILALRQFGSRPRTIARTAISGTTEKIDPSES